MNPSPESIALRTLLLLALALFALFMIGVIISQVEGTPSNAKATLATPEPKVATPIPDLAPPPRVTVRIHPGAIAEPRVPEVRRALPVRVPTASPIPFTPPPHVFVEVHPRVWSEFVHVPKGKRPVVNFTLGRIRIERNGVDIGTHFRNPTMETERVGRQAYNIHVNPLGMLDRTPRSILFGADTRTFRFSSEETTSDTVVVTFK